MVDSDENDAMAKAEILLLRLRCGLFLCDDITIVPFFAKIASFNMTMNIQLVPWSEKSQGYGRAVDQFYFSETVMNRLGHLKILLINVAYSTKNRLNLLLTEKSYRRVFGAF